MTSEPQAPGAPAVYLYRDVSLDDVNGYHDYYDRVKILTRVGLDEATVRIRTPGYASVERVQGRTVRPDGTVVEFDGKVFQAPDGELTSTTFTLPGVEVGSILDYRYRVSIRTMLVARSIWPLSERLFTRAAHFSLLPDRYLTMRMNAPAGLPPGVGHTRKDGRRIVLEAHDLPAYVEEDFSPPDLQTLYRIEVRYSEAAPHTTTIDTNPVRFWNEYARQIRVRFGEFAGRLHALSDALGPIIAPGDPPEAVLRKIYARIQELRHVPEGDYFTEAENQEEREHPIRTAADVWEHRRGNYGQLDWLFLTLVRTAGLQADLVQTPHRDTQFFNPALMDPGELRGNVIAVDIGGSTLYLDPATRGIPFGMLAWAQTGVRALKVGPDSGEWITLPVTGPRDSRIDRRASLRYSDTRGLDGTVEVSYSGYEAIWRRNRELHQDSAARQAFLESDLADSVPVACVVHLLTAPDWTTADTPLVARFSISIPEWVQRAGSRRLLPTGIFGAAVRGLFVTARRVHPLYFWWPYIHEDSVQVELPAGWRVQGLPEASDFDYKAFRFKTGAQGRRGSAQWTRELTLNAMLLPASAYGDVKESFDSVRSSDEQTIVLAGDGSSGE